jgi:hypothetical protein
MHERIWGNAWHALRNEGRGLLRRATPIAALWDVPPRGDGQSALKEALIMLRVCLAAAVIVVLAIPRTASVVTAATGSGVTSGPAVQVTLKEQLEKGLRARRPVEFAFVAEVVQAVEDDRLPIRLVNVSYDWALKQPRHRFQYFEFAITKLAKKQGVALHPAP